MPNAYGNSSHRWGQIWAGLKKAQQLFTVKLPLCPKAPSLSSVKNDCRMRIWKQCRTTYFKKNILSGLKTYFRSDDDGNNYSLLLKNTNRTKNKNIKFYAGFSWKAEHDPICDMSELFSKHFVSSLVSRRTVNITYAKIKLKSTSFASNFQSF